jgi:hypothetical protein
VIGGRTPDALDVLAEPAGKGDGAHVLVGEPARVVLEGAKRARGDQGDDEQRDREQAEGGAQPHGDGQGGEPGHALYIGSAKGCFTAGAARATAGRPSPRARTRGGRGDR